MYSHVVYRNELICLEQAQHFMQKIFCVLLNEKKEVLDIIVVESSKRSSKAGLVRDHVTSFKPKPPNVKPHAM